MNRCVSFPSLYALVVSKEAWVVKLWVYTSQRAFWNTCFFRHLNESELDNVEHFFYILQGREMNRDKEDRLVWKESKDETFSIESL